MTIKQKTLQPGFSFIEMMIVLVIMGILMTMVGPRVMGLLGKGKKASTQSALKVVNQAIKQYKFDVGRLPDRLDDLIKKPENASGWDGPYAGDEDSANPEVQKDGWDQELVYVKKAPGTTPAYELYSNGDPEKEDDRIYATKQ
jgi:general secretion pathway protein G